MIVKKQYVVMSGWVLLNLVLTGCTNYQWMDVTVKQQRTRQPIKNVQVDVTYAEPGWYWPFAPEGDRGVTNGAGETRVKMTWYDRGTYMEIAGVQFEVSETAYRNGAVFQNLNFRASVEPAGPVTDEQPSE